MASSSTTEPWSELFVNITIPNVTEMFLDYLMDDTVQPCEVHEVIPLRMVNRGLRDVVDNYEPVWHCFDQEQPLLMPTLLGHVHNIERLLAKGADVSHHGEQHSRWDKEWCHPPNPLQLAARYGILSSAKILIENGADLTPGKKYHHWEDSGFLNEGFDMEDFTVLNDPMQFAAAHGHIPLIELFLENGVDINAKDAKGQSPLFAACRRGTKETVKWLMEKGADVTADWTNCILQVGDRGWKDVEEVMWDERARAKRPAKRQRMY